MLWGLVSTAFVLVDAILRSSILWCPIRAALLPMAAGATACIPFGMTDLWPMSTLCASAFAATSLLVSTVSCLAMYGFRLRFIAVFREGIRPTVIALVLLGCVIVPIWLIAINQDIHSESICGIKEFGANRIYIFGNGELSQTDRLVDSAPTIKNVMFTESLKSQVRHRDRTAEATIVGCSTGAIFESHEIERGRFLTGEDSESRNNCCVLGAGIAETLFGLEAPIGKPLFIDNAVHVVVGTVAHCDAASAIVGSMETTNYDSRVYVPLTSFRQRYLKLSSPGEKNGKGKPSPVFSQLTLTVDSPTQVSETANALRSMLRQNGDNDGFAVVAPLELLNQTSETWKWIEVAFTVVTCLAVLIFGIGIMRIMLRSVRPLGSEPRDASFGTRWRSEGERVLTEAMVLSAILGKLGISVAVVGKPVLLWGLGCIWTTFPAQTARMLPLMHEPSPEIGLGSACAAFGLSIVIGITFGLYPAIHASRSDAPVRTGD